METSEERKVEIRTNERWIEATRKQILSYEERCKDRIEELNRHISEYEENIERLGGKEE